MPQSSKSRAFERIGYIVFMAILAVIVTVFLIHVIDSIFVYLLAP